jgi:hypothetical protein
MKHVIACVIGLSLISGCSATFSLGDSSARSNGRPAETRTTETASTEARPTEETNAPAATEEPKTEQPTEQAATGGLDPQ